MSLHNDIEKCLKENYGLIVSQAKRFNPKNKHILEEYVQIGVMAFLKAFDKFNPEKGKFSTYISRCIHNAIYDFIISNNKVRFVATDSIEKESVANSFNFDEIIPSNLTSDERQLLELLRKNFSKEEIMHTMNINKYTLYVISNNIKNKIKNATEP